MMAVERDPQLEHLRRKAQQAWRLYEAYGMGDKGSSEYAQWVLEQHRVERYEQEMRDEKG